jgi:hypothetical protein
MTSAERLNRFVEISSVLTGTRLSEVIPTVGFEKLASCYLAAAGDFDSDGLDILLRRQRAAEEYGRSSNLQHLEQFIIALWYTGDGLVKCLALSDAELLSTRALAFRSALLWQVFGSLAKGCPTPELIDNKS